MNIPHNGDYIDIHTHGSVPGEGIFCLENLMVHERGKPSVMKGMAFSCGIHPWYLTETNSGDLLGMLADVAGDPGVVAIGECGFDKLRGPSFVIQRMVFEEQVKIAMEYSKPVIIHCVRAWEELLASHRRLNPSIPWMVHGFRRKKGLAEQLISRNMYLSFWFDFVLRPATEYFLRPTVLIQISGNYTGRYPGIWV